MYKLKQLVLSHSSLCTLHSCERKFEFRQMYGVNRDLEENFAAEVGKALHDAFGVFVSTRGQPPAIREKSAVLELMMKYPYELERTTKKSAERSLEACYATLCALMASEALGDCELVHIRKPNGEEAPAVEVPFAIKILGSRFPLDVYYVGVIDSVFYNHRTQQYIVLDLKTTRQYLTDTGAKYEFDEQCTPYGIILEHLLGKPISSMTVAWLSAYIDLMEPSVQMYEIYRPKEYVLDWHKGLCIDIDTLTDRYNRQWFRRSPTGDSCMAFNRKCSFLEYCNNRNPEIISRMINGVEREGLFSNGMEPWVTVGMNYNI